MGRGRNRGCRVLYRHLKRRESKATGGYSKRNHRIRELGYESYQEYLLSDDWKEIRSSRLRESPYCCVCAGVAIQVHHFCYHHAVLLGLVPELLFTVCDDCHRMIEFDGDEKRTLEAAQEYLLELFRASGRASLADETLHLFRQQKDPRPKNGDRQKKRDERYRRKQETSFHNGTPIPKYYPIQTLKPR